MKVKKLLTAAAVLAACSGAQALTVSFQYGLPVATSTTEINQTGFLGLFDSNLGTLTGAVLTINGASVLSFTGSNSSNQSQIANLTSSTRLVWNSSIDAIDPLINETIAFSLASGNLTYAVGETKSFGPLSQATSQTDNLGSILGSLQAGGGGNFTMNCLSLSGISVEGGGGNIATTQATAAGCGAEIVYTYDTRPTTQVPEPASLALVGLALAGAGFVTRRRKASQS